MREVAFEAQKKSSFSQKLAENYLYHLDNVSVTFDQTIALKNVNLTISPGEIYFITGKSGAGKSTLLNLLAQDLSPCRGSIHSSLKNRFVAQVFQDLKLFDHKTAEENLWYAFDRKIYKKKSDFHHDMMELVTVMGIKSKLNLRIANANGGLKQKIAIIRALLTRPAILLADEPTSSMDNESAHKIFEVLNYYNSKRRLTIIWASHNRELVKQFPGKIAHLEAGKLVYSGHACFI